MTWLCGIAANLWRKYLRDHKSSENLSDYEDLLTNRSAEDDALIQWEHIKLLKLLHHLNEPIKEVMYLRLIGELSFAQIGEIMEKSENWARVNFYRGKKRIMEEMQK